MAGVRHGAGAGALQPGAWRYKLFEGLIVLIRRRIC
jgi:hypothetical protein